MIFYKIYDALLIKKKSNSGKDYPLSFCSYRLFENEIVAGQA